MKPILIDGIDYTSYFAETGYQVSYSTINGGQGGYTLAGTSIVDELDQKAVVTLPCMPLTEAQFRTILEALMPTPVHSVTYYDPLYGTRTVSMVRSVISGKYRGQGADLNEYWTGQVIKLTER